MTSWKLTRCEDELHRDAIRESGLDDFGDTSYRQGLKVLLGAFDSELKLTDAGYRAMYNSILRILIARLYTQKGWTEHPEVLSTSIHRPVVIIGLPRTGTTALHKLLSVDPQFQGLQYWLTQRPMIRPQREAWETHPAYLACVTHINQLYARLPEIPKLHTFSADEVEECVLVLNQDFTSSIWPVLYDLPTYNRWLSRQRTSECYRRYANVLRLIGAGETRRRWLLKCPHHMVDVDALLEAFPDACIIHTHRDPLRAISSLCSLVRMVGRDITGEAEEGVHAYQRQCAHWRRGLECVQAARQRSPAQFFDADHRRFLTDPMGLVHSIYEHFGLTLLPDVQQQMQEWVATRPTYKHGRHDHTLDEEARVLISDVFSEYRARYQFT